jgi:hypothetical protein
VQIEIADTRNQLSMTSWLGNMLCSVTCFIPLYKFQSKHFILQSVFSKLCLKKCTETHVNHHTKFPLSLCNWNLRLVWNFVKKNHSAILRLLYVIRHMVMLIGTFLQLSILKVPKVPSVMVSDWWLELLNLYSHCFQLPPHLSNS